MAEELQYLDSLNSKNTLFLIRQLSTGRILTGRRVNPEQMAVYARIRQQEIPHVPFVRDIIQEADGQYLVMQDYIQGVTLEQLLAERHFLAYPETAHIGVQVCQALEGLHAFGIIHRDVKPANIMVTSDNTAYLIDFDISRTRKDNQQSDTAILGTQGYAAPEQFGFQQTDARADIYSLGVLLNQMCTGVFSQTQLADPPLNRIIQKCTEIDPKKRYSNAASVRKALEMAYPEAKTEFVPPVIPESNHKTGIPGFRSGNPFYILIAVLGYGIFAIFTLAILSVAFRSLSDFIIAFCILAAPIGCYLFAFDLFKVRTNCKLVERYRNTRQYSFYCVCLAIVWVIIWFIVMFFGVGILSEFSKAK